MDKKNQLDNIWKSTLKKEVEKIDVPEELLNKIKSNYGYEKNIRRITINNIKNLFYPFQLNTLRIILTSVLFVLFLTAQLLIFSENARVFALDSIDSAFTVVYRIVGYENGEYKIEKTPLEQPEWVYHDHVFFSDKYIEQIVGYNIYLPKALSDSYNPISGRNIYAVEGKNGNKNYMVSVIYSDNTSKNDSIVLETTIDKDNYFFSKMYNIKDYTVGNKEVVWGECPHLIYSDNDPRQQPVNLDILHVLMWENNGVYYRLWSTNNNLAIDKGLRFVDEIINNKCPKKTTFKHKGVRYGKNDISNNEIINMVGHPVRIPYMLNEGFSLEYKTVSTITDDDETGYEVCGYYKKDNRHLKIAMAKIDENYSMLKGLPSTEVLDIGDIEYYWCEKNNSKGLYDQDNLLEFKVDGVNYLLSILDGSFKSKAEAISIAQSILDSN